tara:strand:- start:474 stop:689 length:216 start_codon:yes stop_codon:yes gene_type:complete
MSKIKEYYLNHLTEEEMNQISYQTIVDDSEIKSFFVKRLRNQIIELKMSNKDNKKKIQKLQQNLDKITETV